jgi:hypothetical protein
VSFCAAEQRLRVGGVDPYGLVALVSLTVRRR